MIARKMNHRAFAVPRNAVEPLERRTLLSAAAWPTVDSYAAPDTETYLYGMTADSAGNVYAVGTSQYDSIDGVIREKLNGSSTWTEILHLANTELYSVAVDAKGDVYACGERSGLHWLVVERPAGQSNFTVVDDSGTTDGQCTGLTTDSLGNVYAVGFLSVPTTKGANTTYTRYWAVRKQTGGAGAFATVDQFDVTSGNGIDTELAARASSATSIASGASAGLYVAGREADKWVVRKSSDAGKTWATVDPGYVYDPANVGTAGARSILGDGLGNLYAGGYAARRTITGYTGKGNKTPVYSTVTHWIVRKSSDGGVSWAINDDFLPTGFTDVAAIALATDSAGHVYAAGTGNFGSNTSHALVRANTGTDASGTPNGSWVTVAENPGTTPYGAYNEACAVDTNGTVYAGGSDVNSALYDEWVVRSPAVATPSMALAATAGTAAAASSSGQAVQVYAPHTHGIGEASADWWQWALAFSNDNPNPFTDPTGHLASLNQSGHVFFMPGVAGPGTFTRNVQVPAGQPVLVPLVVTELSTLEGYGDTPKQVRSADKAFADLIDSLSVTIDGVPVPDLFAHREVSPTFHFVAAPNNPIGDPEGDSGVAEADGYWLMLAPMAGGGTHVIHSTGGVSSFGVTFDVTTTFTVTGGKTPAANTPLPMVSATGALAAGTASSNALGSDDDSKKGRSWDTASLLV
jgi:hypothetical protein